MIPHEGGDCRKYFLGSDAACRRVMTSYCLCETSLTEALVHADSRRKPIFFCDEREKNIGLRAFYVSQRLRNAMLRITLF